MTATFKLPIHHPATSDRFLQGGDEIRIERSGSFPDSVHVFEQSTVDAVNCAFAACRPLLVRGEPGTGKSQLAYAVAAVLNWPCRAKVVDARTESRDLMYEFDIVERLGAAQTLGAARMSLEEIRKELDPKKFVRPGPLWWAFDWSAAAARARPGKDSKNEIAIPPGCVVLIDEIDKGDVDVPNGLLECLGQGEFQAPGEDEPIAAKGRPFFVVITTNEEKTLPAPFQRRCIVLHLDLPERPDQLIETLCARAARHFPESAGAVRVEAATLLLEHRTAAKNKGLVRPGQAEYLDLVRSVTRLAAQQNLDELRQVELVRCLREYAYDKNPREEGR